MTPNALPAERTAKGLALEHAEYMAKGAERFQRQAGAAMYLHNEGREVPEHLWESISESHRALSSQIYEFRKRRDRACSQPTIPADEWLDGLTHLLVDLCMDDDAVDEIMAHARRHIDGE